MLRGSSGSPDILISFRRSDGRFEMPPGGLFLGWVYISFQFSLADIPSRTFPPSGRPSERRNHVFSSIQGRDGRYRPMTFGDTGG